MLMYALRHRWGRGAEREERGDESGKKKKKKT